MLVSKSWVACGWCEDINRGGGAGEPGEDL